MEELAKKAFFFLCKRNVLEIEQGTYFSLLCRFEEAQGEKALIALAGFYQYVIDNIKDAQAQDQALKETFEHDLYGARDKFLLPRSDDYYEFFY